MRLLLSTWSRLILSDGKFNESNAISLISCSFFDHDKSKCDSPPQKLSLPQQKSIVEELSGKRAVIDFIHSGVVLFPMYEEIYMCTRFRFSLGHSLFIISLRENVIRKLPTK